LELSLGENIHSRALADYNIWRTRGVTWAAARQTNRVAEFLVFRIVTFGVQGLVAWDLWGFWEEEAGQ